MSVNLDDYKGLVEELTPASQEALRAAWLDATRIFSPRGLDNYLKGAVALKSLGRGCDLVVAWLENSPLVGKEVGEDVVSELATTALALASKTSGAVIEMIIATAPTAAKRLGDADLFRKYLQFLNTLVAQAPRGVRPMLDKLDVLLTQLTLGGLRRWALWGAHAHRTSFEEQIRYFSLESKESLAVLQKEHKGTLFIDVQRRINMYLRALWGRDFFLKPTSGDFETREGYRPYIEDYFIHLPDAYDDFTLPEGGTIPGLELYRAAAAHAAAHVMATREPISAEGLNTWQMAVIAVIEDARVESLAIRRFPGLKQLWAQFHTATPAHSATAGHYLDRLARALLDQGYQDDDPWIQQGRCLLAEVLAQPGRLETNRTSWELGVTLAHAFREKKIPFNPRTDVLSAPYRDDNRYFWAFDGFDFEKAIAAGYETHKQVRKYVSVMEMVNEVDNELAGDDAQEVWVLATPFYLDQEGVTINELEGKEPVSPPFHYPEWDYQIQLERPSWATVVEKRPRLGDLALIDAITAQHRRLVSRMKFLLDALQPQGVQRVRKLEDGDEIDLNAAIRARIDMRIGHQPDPRIMMRSLRKTRDISVLVLLDLSESTNNKVAGQEYSVLELTRQACVLLADAITKVGDPFAIHGFCSDGRHDVQYYRFKDFGEPWEDKPKARIAGMSGQLSTRMGAAIRHATHHLRQQKSVKKLLMVITDGEPADVDVRDPQYLHYDTKKAVEEAGRAGVVTFCMSLDSRADPYVSRIFGVRNYMVVDHVERLPEKLPLLYAALTR